MSLLLVTFAIEYSGGRLDQLRIDPIRRDCCFYAAGDYLLDDLKALRIPLPNFVHVSRDCSRVKYTWSASTDPRRPIDLTREIVAAVDRASREHRLLDRLEIRHLDILEGLYVSERVVELLLDAVMADLVQDRSMRARAQNIYASTLAARISGPARAIATVPRQVPTLLSRMSMGNATSDASRGVRYRSRVLGASCSSSAGSPSRALACSALVATTLERRTNPESCPSSSLSRISIRDTEPTPTTPGMLCKVGSRTMLPWSRATSSSSRRPQCAVRDTPTLATALSASPAPLVLDGALTHLSPPFMPRNELALGAVTNDNESGPVDVAPLDNNASGNNGKVKARMGPRRPRAPGSRKRRLARRLAVGVAAPNATQQGVAALGSLSTVDNQSQEHFTTADLVVESAESGLMASGSGSSRSPSVVDSVPLALTQDAGELRSSLSAVMHDKHTPGAMDPATNVAQHRLPNTLDDGAHVFSVQQRRQAAIAMQASVARPVEVVVHPAMKALQYSSLSMPGGTFATQSVSSAPQEPTQVNAKSAYPFVVSHSGQVVTATLPSTAAAAAMPPQPVVIQEKLSAAS